MSALKMGKVQFRIMQVLWSRGRANAREITEDLNEISPIAHSTVQTLLRKLEQKGTVDHDIEDRTFIFYALVDRRNVTKYAYKEFVDRLFSGSASGLIAYLIKSEEIPAEEFEEIRSLIDERDC